MRSRVSLVPQLACFVTATVLAIAAAAAAGPSLALQQPPRVEVRGGGSNSRLVVLTSSDGRVRTFKWVCIRCTDSGQSLVPPSERMTQASGPQTSTQNQGAFSSK